MTLLPEHLLTPITRYSHGAFPAVHGPHQNPHQPHVGDQQKGHHLSDIDIVAPDLTADIKHFRHGDGKSQGSGFDQLRQEALKHFQSVVTRKPEASRSRSSEVYLLARKFKG